LVDSNFHLSRFDLQVHFEELLGDITHYFRMVLAEAHALRNIYYSLAALAKAHTH
jgi:hypothetical protein